MKLFLIVSLLISILGFTGCQNPLLESSKAFLNTVGPEYLKYVEEDPTLDSNAKHARRINVEEFKAIIEEAEK